MVIEGAANEFGVAESRPLGECLQDSVIAKHTILRNGRWMCYFAFFQIWANETLSVYDEHPYCSL